MSYKSEELSPAKKAGMVKTWLSEIHDAQKREKKYRQMGHKCVGLYEAKDPNNIPFSILYSNTETLAPAVYNARPIPIVTRRFKDADPVGKAVAEVSTRVLKFLIDNEARDYDSFDELNNAAVLDGLVTNRGLAAFKYVAREGDHVSECVYGESIRWDKFFHGYGRTWKAVPWIGFELDMTKDELKKNFPGKKLDQKAMDRAEEDKENGEDPDELVGVKTFKVYKIWDKKTRKVLFLSDCCKEEPLRIVDDPLGLSNFFPIPRPVNFMRKITTLVPTPLYQQYIQQAEELNELTRRLKAIVKAIKFRGAYNKTVEGIEKMLEAGDNELVPVENMQSMPDNTGIDKIIYTVPVNELVQTAQSLYQQREQVKQVIYEITGVSDILRGASVASETATAQNIKNQWGTLRLKRYQKEVQRYCREALAIMLEIAAAKFELQTFRQMTGLPYLTEQEKAAAQQQIQQIKMQIDMQAQAQGQQPQYPPIPPEIEEALAAPSWEDILKVMQNDVALHYKVDIETNSTIDAEAAQDKQDIAELMNAVSQFLNGVAPLVEKGTMSIDVAKSMLLVVSRRFNFGSQLEDALNQMKAPEPQQDPDEAQKAELAKVELQVKSAEAQAKMRQLQAEGALEQQKFQNEKELMTLEAQIKREELIMQREKLAMDAQAMRNKAAFQERQHKQRMEAKTQERADATV